MTISVFIIGPSGIGKTWIANHLADVSESLNTDYHETQGLRILEISRKLLLSKRESSIDIELWDISGNPKFHSLLPGISKEATCIIYVTNNKDDEFKQWKSLFPHLSESQVLVINLGESNFKQDSWNNSQSVQLSLDESSVLKLKSEFDKFLISVYSIAQDKKEQEESLIAGN